MISWRLKHRLFGWHYVHAKNTATDIVRRVRRTATGERYIVYFGHHIAFTDRPGGDGWKITELTGDVPGPPIAPVEVQIKDVTSRPTAKSSVHVQRSPQPPPPPPPPPQ